MAFWLRSEERRVAARGRRVRADVAALDDARRRFASGIRRELARPKVLLALFAAGLGFGFARRGAARAGTRSEAGVPDSERTGRLAKLVAAVLAGVRIYAEVRRAAGLVERGAAPQRDAGGGIGSAAFRQDASDDTQQDEAHDRHEHRE